MWRWRQDWFCRGLESGSARKVLGQAEHTAKVAVRIESFDRCDQREDIARQITAEALHANRAIWPLRNGARGSPIPVCWASNEEPASVGSRSLKKTERGTHVAYVPQLATDLFCVRSVQHGRGRFASIRDEVSGDVVTSFCVHIATRNHVCTASVTPSETLRLSVTQRSRKSLASSGGR